MKKINIKNKEIFNYNSPYIIAEIGANHNGDMKLAKEMILSAKNNGADCVKFQSWTPTSLVSKEEYQRNQVYTDSKKKHFGSLEEMVKTYALTDENHFELKAYCDKIDIDFASSPFSIDEAKLLDEVGVPFYKVASMDINNYPFIRELAKFQKPIILSTGMATLAEIENAVKTCYEESNKNIILLHCISIYPPEYKDIHLNNIKMLQQTFDLPVGFSDHTIGTSIPLASVALGACLIEKHFTTDKNLPGWDHEISADPEELKTICEQSKNIAESLGDFQRIVSEAEEKKKLLFRRSLVVTKDLKKGHIITEADLSAKRPGTKIPPNEISFVLNRKLNCDVNNDDILDYNMFE